MSNKAAISLTTGHEDAERCTVALLVAVGAAEGDRPTVMFLTKEAVRLALDGTGVGTACEGSDLRKLMNRTCAEVLFLVVTTRRNPLNLRAVGYRRVGGGAGGHAGHAGAQGPPCHCP